VVGLKYDEGKDRWDLLPWKALTQVVKVVTYGARKYGECNWQHVDRGQERYFAAMQRHIAAWRAGDATDDETGLHHLAHAACSALFLIWMDGYQ